MADNTRKKKVKAITFMLSKKEPIHKTIMYSVIQSNSAVKSKCKADVTFTEMLEKRIKKIKIYKLTSPKCKI